MSPVQFRPPARIKTPFSSFQKRAFLFLPRWYPNVHRLGIGSGLRSGLHFSTPKCPLHSGRAFTTLADESSRRNHFWGGRKSVFFRFSVRNPYAPQVARWSVSNCLGRERIVLLSDRLSPVQSNGWCHDFHLNHHVAAAASTALGTNMLAIAAKPSGRRLKKNTEQTINRTVKDTITRQPTPVGMSVLLAVFLSPVFSLSESLAPADCVCFSFSFASELAIRNG